MTWHEALTDGRSWDQQRDAPRLRKAFVTLARTRTSWPAPLHLIEALPKVEPLKAIPSTLPDPARAERYMDEIAKELHIDRKSAAAGGDK